MKLTAIETLKEMINEYPCSGLTDSKPLDDVMIWIDEFLLEIEEKQIKNAYQKGYEDQFSFNENYYEETFKIK